MQYFSVLITETVLSGVARETRPSILVGVATAERTLIESRAMARTREIMMDQWGTKIGGRHFIRVYQLKLGSGHLTFPWLGRRILAVICESKEYEHG